MATLAHRGLAKILEDRAEFEVVADVLPESVREKVFTAAAEHRKALRDSGQARSPFRRDAVLEEVARSLEIGTDQVAAALFADLRDENRLLSFDQAIDAQRLLDRYNVALAQSVLLRSVLIEVEVRNEKPARYRQLFRHLKFHRLLYRVEGSMREGYKIHIDGPLSLFSATNKYGLQMALFLPALLLCSDFRLDAEVRWGPKRDPRTFHLESNNGLVSHYADTGTFVPAEMGAFVDRFRQVAPAWELSEAAEVVELGPRRGLGARLQVHPQGDRRRRARRDPRLLEAIKPRPPGPTPPPAWTAPLPPGDLRPLQGRRGGARRAARPRPPVPRNPQRDRARRPPRPFPRRRPGREPLRVSRVSGASGRRRDRAWSTVGSFNPNWILRTNPIRPRRMIVR